MYKMTLIISRGESFVGATVVDGPDILELKDSINERVVQICENNNIVGEVEVEMQITRDGEYYDHDEATINISSGNLEFVLN